MLTERLKKNHDIQNNKHEIDEEKKKQRIILSGRYQFSNGKLIQQCTFSMFALNFTASEWSKRFFKKKEGSNKIMVL